MSRRDQVQRKIGDDWRRLSRIAHRAIEYNDFASDHEWRFVNQIAERLAAWREEAFVSLKQMQWLHSIDERLDREGLGETAGAKDDEGGIKPVDEFIAENTR